MARIRTVVACRGVSGEEGDDEALARYADELAAAIDAALGPWIVGFVEARAQGRADAARDVAEGVRRELMPEVRSLLATDIDRQRATPLQLLRRAGGPVAGLLADAGVPVPPSDEVARELDPDDRYDLGPAAYADLGPEVGEAGLRWGAAKAHVHLRRRRSSG
jgi:hypothetical protein